MNIYLIGFMAAGKSTIGPLLAEKLDYAFVDSDAELERNSGEIIDSIIKNEGEDIFRKYETETLKALSNYDQQMIAVGGGAPTIEANWEFFNQGVTIYLDVSIELLIERLKQAKRPLLEGLSDTARAEKIRSMFAQRTSFYQRADIQILAEGEPQKIVEHIQEQVASCKL